MPGLKVHFARLHPEWAVYGIFTPGWISMFSQMVPGLRGETQDGKEVIFLLLQQPSFAWIGVTLTLLITFGIVFLDDPSNHGRWSLSLESWYGRV